MATALLRNKKFKPLFVMEVGAHPDATDEYMLYPRKVSFWNTAMTFGKTHEKKVTVTQIS